MSKIREATDDNFPDPGINSEKPGIVDFWAAWCPPCHQIAPVLEQIANERAGRLRIVQMDYDANPVTPSNYRGMGLPTLILFEGGREVARQSGALDFSALLAWVESHA